MFNDLDERLKYQLFPQCCDKMIQAMSVQAYVSGEDKDELPRWHVEVSSFINTVQHRNVQIRIKNDDTFLYIDQLNTVTYCPHCATKLPGFKKKENPPEKVYFCLDGGYYCETCNDRANECTCAPPISEWEMKEE
jgi:hypothetical protein